MSGSSFSSFTFFLFSLISQTFRCMQFHFCSTLLPPLHSSFCSPLTSYPPPSLLTLLVSLLYSHPCSDATPVSITISPLSFRCPYTNLCLYSYPLLDLRTTFPPFPSLSIHIPCLRHHPRSTSTLSLTPQHHPVLTPLFPRSSPYQSLTYCSLAFPPPAPQYSATYLQPHDGLRDTQARLKDTHARLEEAMDQFMTKDRSSCRKVRVGELRKV